VGDTDRICVSSSASATSSPSYVISLLASVVCCPAPPPAILLCSPSSPWLIISPSIATAASSSTRAPRPLLARVICVVSTGALACGVSPLVVVLDSLTGSSGACTSSLSASESACKCVVYVSALVNICSAVPVMHHSGLLSRIPMHASIRAYALTHV